MIKMLNFDNEHLGISQSSYGVGIIKHLLVFFAPNVLTIGQLEHNVGPNKRLFPDYLLLVQDNGTRLYP